MSATPDTPHVEAIYRQDPCADRRLILFVEYSRDAHNAIVLHRVRLNKRPVRRLSRDMRASILRHLVALPRSVE